MRKRIVFLHFLVLSCFFNVSLALAMEGTFKWKYPIGSAVSSPAVGDDGTIYIGSDNYLYALNTDGTQRWTFETGWAIASSPAIGGDGTIYVGSWDQSLYAINPNGTKKWSFYTPYRIVSSPAIGPDGAIYFITKGEDDNLYALNQNGKKKWAAAIGGGTSSPAVASDGTVYVMTSVRTLTGWECKLLAVDLNGTIAWIYSFSSGCYNSDYYPVIRHSSPAIGSDGAIYIGQGNSLYAINPDGTKRWEFRTGDEVDASPSILRMVSI